MQLESRVFVEPGDDVRVFRGGVVVQNQVYVKTFGYFLIDSAQKLQEFLVPVFGQARADDRAGERSRTAINIPERTP